MEFIISKGDTQAKCTTVGGELISFVKDGKEYVWYGHAEHWSGQAPCLFPVVCRAKDDCIIIDGKAYPMKKHGFARKVEYTPVEVTPSSVTLRLTESEETKALYPYYFPLSPPPFLLLPPPFPSSLSLFLSSIFSPFPPFLSLSTLSFISAISA